MKQTNLILTKESSTSEIRAYFNAILQLSQSHQDFPINLDEVWMLVYNKKSDAVSVLLKTFIQDVDYQVLRQNPQNPKGGRPKINYYLSVSCLEYFIARKVRPVFEVYRKVFHKSVQCSTKTISFKDMKKLKEEVERLEYSLKWARISQRQETELKNSCFFFLIGKGLYNEYHGWLQKQLTDRILTEIKESLII